MMLTIYSLVVVGSPCVLAILTFSDPPCRPPAYLQDLATAWPYRYSFLWETFLKLRDCCFRNMLRFLNM